MKITGHDIDLFEREQELPGLATVLDPEDIGSRIAAKLGVGRIDVRPNYVRLKPGVNCLVGYSFQADGIPPMGYAKAFTPSDRPKLLKAAKKFGRPGSGSTQTLLLEDLETVIHFFPFDGRLSSLSYLNEWKAKETVLPRMFADDRDLSGATLTPIRYKPERRFVARLEMPNGEAFAVKFLTRDDFKRAKIAAKQVVRRSGVNAAALAGNSDRYHLLAFDWLKGSVLTGHFRSSGYQPAVFDALGGMMAQFHSSKVRKLQSRTLKSVLAAADAAVASTVHVMPDLWHQATSILNNLSKELGDQWTSRLVPVHGDFYADQVLVDENRVTILDFDSAVFSQCESDVANLLAHLICDALRGLVPDDSFAQVRSHLIGTYREHELPVDERLLDLLTAVSLLQLLPQPFRTRADNWPEITKGILSSAGDLLEDAQLSKRTFGPVSTTRLSSDLQTSDDSEARIDGQLVAAATDVNGMDVLIKRTLWGANRSSHEPRLVVSSTIVKRNPGRRCLVAYELADGQTILGKIRVKGLDRRAATLQQALWSGEFGPTSTDGVRVAEPLGEIPELQMWLQRYIHAPTAWAELASDRVSDFAGRLAGALCKLQRSGPLIKRVHTLEDEMAILIDRLEGAGGECADMKGEITELAHACRRLADGLPPRSLVPAHRDFYPDNVLVDGTSVWIVDLDLYCRSHPALDAGNFVGHLWEASVRGSVDAGVARNFEDRFVSVLSGEFGSELGLEVETFAVLTLARHVAISRRIQDRRPVTRAILESALRRSSDLVSTIYQ